MTSPPLCLAAVHFYTQSLRLPSYAAKCPLPCLYTYHTQSPFICNDDNDDDADNDQRKKPSGARSRCARLGSGLRHPSHQGRLPGHRVPGLNDDDDNDDDDNDDDDDQGRLPRH